MQLLKLALISIVVLFCVVTAIGLLFPSTIEVTRAVNINASPDSVKPFITNISNWKLWMQNTNNASILFKTTQTSGEGTIANISGNEITIAHVTKDSIQLIWKTPGGKIQMSNFEFISDSLKPITRLQWHFQQQLKWYPWERFGAMMNDKILGPLMDSSLNDLKRKIEFHLW